MRKKWGYVSVIIICLVIISLVKGNCAYFIKETSYFLTKPSSHHTGFIDRDIFNKTISVKEALHEREVERIIEQMSLDEKIGQMMFSGMTGKQERVDTTRLDRKSTRLNSSHVAISYAVFCLKK